MPASVRDVAATAGASLALAGAGFALAFVLLRRRWRELLSEPWAAALPAVALSFAALLGPILHPAPPGEQVAAGVAALRQDPDLLLSSPPPGLGDPTTRGLLPAVWSFHLLALPPALLVGERAAVGALAALTLGLLLLLLHGLLRALDWPPLAAPCAQALFLLLPTTAAALREARHPALLGQLGLLALGLYLVRRLPHLDGARDAAAAFAFLLAAQLAYGPNLVLVALAVPLTACYAFVRREWSHGWRLLGAWAATLPVMLAVHHEMVALYWRHRSDLAVVFTPAAPAEPFDGEAARITAQQALALSFGWPHLLAGLGGLAVLARRRPHGAAVLGSWLAAALVLLGLRARHPFWGDALAVEAAAAPVALLCAAGLAALCGQGRAGRVPAAAAALVVLGWALIRSLLQGGW